MSMGRRKEERQSSLFVMAESLPRSGGHPFYQRLNKLLAEAGFDRWIEARCSQYYEQEELRGSRSIPPGVYFRMLLVGYFEDISSQRGIAWRCADSLSLRQLLGLTLEESTPVHASLTHIRKRLPEEVFSEVFQFVLRIAGNKKLLSGKTVAVDSTTLEANAAMKSIVRRDTGEDWKEYVTRLMQEEGSVEKPLEQSEGPSDEDLRRFDQGRKNKKVSNDEWVSETDADARIAKLKDGRTHLAYKAEHVVDLQDDLILAAEIYEGDHSDTATLVDSVMQAQGNLQGSGLQQEIREVVADKGYHAAEQLELADSLGLRTYIPEPRRQHRRRWKGKPLELQQAVYANRRRVRTSKSKRLQRRRSELCERTFAHVCNTGGSRRSWLRGLTNVRKRYLLAAAAHNLGRILRKLFGAGKPRALQGEFSLTDLLTLLVRAIHQLLHRQVTPPSLTTPYRTLYLQIKTTR